MRFLFRICEWIIFLSILILFSMMGNNTEQINIGFLFFEVFFMHCLALVIHEIGHFLYLTVKKIKVQSIHFPIIHVRICSNRVKLVPSVTFTEGMIIPSVSLILSENQYDTEKKHFTHMILSGPLFTVLICILLDGLVILYWHQHVFDSKLLVATIVFSVQSIFILHNCFCSAKGKEGDIVVFERMEESAYYVKYLYQCLIFQDDYKQAIQKNVLIKEKLLVNLKGSEITQICRDIDTLDTILYYSITGLDTYFNLFLNDNLQEIMNELLEELFLVPEFSKFDISPYCHGIICLYQVLLQQNIAYEYYKRAEDKLIQISNGDKVAEYYLGQVQYILELPQGKNFLRKNRPNRILAKLYEQYEDCEKKIVKLL